MTESLMKFVGFQPIEALPKIPRDTEFWKPYWFNGHMIGFLNQDDSMFKLIRTSQNFTTRTYPNETQISRQIILDLMINKKTRRIYIEIDGVIKYYTTPRTWFQHGRTAKLVPTQEDQLFLPLTILHKVRQ